MGAGGCIGGMRLLQSGFCAACVRGEMIDLIIRIVYAIDRVENRFNRWVMRHVGIVQTIIVAALLALTAFVAAVAAGAK